MHRLFSFGSREGRAAQLEACGHVFLGKPALVHFQHKAHRLGGAMALRIGVMRVLMIGAVLSAASNVLFVVLSTRGHDLTGLIWVISADNLAGGVASAAFIAYLSSLTNVNYSATQYALFSSMMLLLPKFLAGYSGRYVDAFGYADFFVATALLGLPVLLLVWLSSRIKMSSSP
jgi:PAT family beta-lactamase induction signal transducer AmpG